MKTLLLMRHAKSSWKTPGQADFDRPLNARGRRDAPRMAERLKEAGRIPDGAIVSDALRARQTWECMAESVKELPPTRFSDQLYHAPPEDILEVAATARDAQTLLILGHNPGIALLAGQLAGPLDQMPTAAIAFIDLAIDDWAEIRHADEGRLADFWYPKDDA